MRVLLISIGLICLAGVESAGAGRAVAGGSGEAIAGSVVDTSSAPVPRATVRVVDPAGAELARALTDTRGRFRFDGLDCPDCSVHATLTGFEPASAPAAGAADLRLVLAIESVAENVLVTATRTEAPSSQLGTSASVIGARDLADRQTVAAADLLRTLPATAVVRTGGLGTVSSVFIRGGESNYTKVLLDGIPLNEPGGFFNFGNLTTDHLDRIEVVRGPQSALFGSDAMTGVIQLFSSHADALTVPVQVSGAVEAGSFDSWRGRAALAGRVSTFTYRVEGARLETDNQEPNNAFRQTSAGFNIGGSLGARTTIRAVGRGVSGRVGTPGQTAFGRPDADAHFDRRDGFVGLSARVRTTPRWEQRVLYSLADSFQASRNLVEDPPFTPGFEGRSSPFLFFDFLFESITDLRRHHLAYQSDWRTGSIGSARGEHIVTAAFEWDHEAGTLDNRLSPGSTVDASRDNFGWTAQHQMLWRRLFVTTSARIEDNASFGTEVVPRVAVAYLVRTAQGGRVGATKLRASGGLGIKEPSLLQSFSPNPFFEGNPDLAPERTRGFDVGLEQRFWHERAKLEVAWFDNRFRNLIALATTDPDQFFARYFNIGRSRARGTELVIELAPGAGVRALATYTHLDSRITRSTSTFSPVFREGQALFRRPRHSGSIVLGWDRDRLNVTASGVFVGRRVDSDFSALDPPIVSSEGYVRWDVAGSLRLTPQVTWVGAVENLFDRRYMEPLGFPALGRAARTGLRFVL